MVTDNKLACSLFFTKVDPGNAECRDYKCKICDTTRKANKTGGYTNLTDIPYVSDGDDSEEEGGNFDLDVDIHAANEI